MNGLRRGGVELLVINRAFNSQSKTDLDRVLKALFFAYLKTGEQGFFNWFYRLTKKQYLSYSNRILQTMAQGMGIDSEEVVSYAYGAMCLNFKTGNPVSYGLGVLKKRIIHLRRKKGRRFLTLNDQLPSEARDPLSRLIHQEEQQTFFILKNQIARIVNNEIMGLSKRQRGLLRDHYYKRRSIKQIALANEVSPSSLYALLHRTKTKVKRMVLSLVG